MPGSHFLPSDKPGTPVRPLTPEALDEWLKTAPDTQRGWVEAHGYRAKAGKILALPAADGVIGEILYGLGNDDTAAGPWAYAALYEACPAGDIRLADNALPPAEAAHFALGWGLAAYRFHRYKKTAKPPEKRLVWPAGTDRAEIERQLDAIYLIRDLINTPANDLGPQELADAAAVLAKEFGATCTVIRGEALLERNFPAIHAVGRGSERPPCLADLRWGDEDAPKLTLIGKGVCFDTGGLDLKSSGNMRLMKKDMGGAAHVLGLARTIMDAHLPVRLRVLIPCVENTVAGDAMRPRDILQTRQGLTIEIGNTDAEGRLILADALTEADSENPDLLIDMATLTGAARSALGPDLPALFTPDDDLAGALAEAAAHTADPLWRLPLFAPYDRWLDSRIADLSNTGDQPFAGAITAALFLKRFVRTTRSWAHFDIYGWSKTGRPGRPEGGEAHAVRALYAYLKLRFGSAA